MTDKEKLEAIKAELHRLKEVRGVYKDIFNDIFTFINSLPEEPKIGLKEESDIYNALAKFIGSFSKRDFDIAKHFYELGHTEEPVSEDLGEIVLEGTNFNKSWYAHPELAFKAGAQWQKNHIWHDASEEPEDGKELLVLTKGNSIKSVKSYTNENYKNEFYDIIWWKLSEQKAWCYLSDVLPKED